MAFGSIDVPSVVEKRDLELFCMLDYQHSQCIDECGYSVQFNLREYVCRNRFPEVDYWMKDFTKQSKSRVPMTCRKVQCKDFKLANCRSQQRYRKRVIDN
uniref:Uncharacterized protein n=1 Tax=Caenorhabditis japonica TaxID=281687 RepID=A0A8R1ETD4_CAEJA